MADIPRKNAIAMREGEGTAGVESDNMSGDEEITSKGAGSRSSTDLRESGDEYERARRRRYARPTKRESAVEEPRQSMSFAASAAASSAASDSENGARGGRAG